MAEQNFIGDYMLNLRTGYISKIKDDFKIEDPECDNHLNMEDLNNIRTKLIQGDKDETNKK